MKKTTKVVKMASGNTSTHQQPATHWLHATLKRALHAQIFTPVGLCRPCLHRQTEVFVVGCKWTTDSKHWSVFGLCEVWRCLNLHRHTRAAVDMFERVNVTQTAPQTIAQSSQYLVIVGPVNTCNYLGIQVILTATPWKICRIHAHIRASLWLNL
jgi:hypothetical protein